MPGNNKCKWQSGDVRRLAEEFKATLLDALYLAIPASTLQSGYRDKNIPGLTTIPRDLRCPPIFLLFSHVTVFLILTLHNYKIMMGDAC